MNMETLAKAQISTEEVRLTASLSELRLNGAEIEPMSTALTTMLGYFTMLDQVSETADSEDDAAVSPLEHRVSLTKCRADELRPDGLSPQFRRELTASSPDFEDEYFFVPRIK